MLGFRKGGATVRPNPSANRGWSGTGMRPEDHDGGRPVTWRCSVATDLQRCSPRLNSRADFSGEPLTLCETGFASGGLTQDRWTSHTQNHRLSVTEHRGDLVASYGGNGNAVSAQRVNATAWAAETPYLDISHPWSKSWDSGLGASSCASSSPPQGTGATSLLQAKGNKINKIWSSVKQD